MVQILIPKAVVEHWQPKFEDLRTHGVSQSGDATYAKVMAAFQAGKQTRIEADLADLREIEAECRSILNDETDISVGRDQEDRRFKKAYLTLREAVRTAAAHETAATASAPAIAATRGEAPSMQEPVGDLAPTSKEPSLGRTQVALLRSMIANDCDTWCTSDHVWRWDTWGGTLRLMKGLTRLGCMSEASTGVRHHLRFTITEKGRIAGQRNAGAAFAPNGRVDTSSGRIRSAGQAPPIVLSKAEHHLIDQFVRSRNALRSAEAAAAGLVSGTRIQNLKAEQKAMTEALLNIGDWVEEQARVALGLPSIPGRCPRAST